MNQKRNQNFENTLLKQTLSILFCPEPVHVPFGIKSQHICFVFDSKSPIFSNLEVCKKKIYTVTIPKYRK